MTGIDLMAEYTFLSKYSQKKPDGSLENWSEAVNRIYEMHRIKLMKMGIYNTEIQKFLNRACELERDKRILSSQRARQFASANPNSGILKHEAKIYNCSSTLIDRVSVFSEIMYLLLCGCGVGYSLHRGHIGKLPIVATEFKEDSCTFVPEDSIEGWADVINYLMHCIFYGIKPKIDFSPIRPKGALIDGKFLAPGPEKLIIATDAIWNICMGAKGRKLKSLEIHDICCWIASSVMSGGIRRSAMIALFDKDDTDMRDCKKEYGWWQDPEKWVRSYANNSILTTPETALTHAEIKEALESVRSYGEPGFVRVNNFDYTVNPCGEIVMNPRLYEDGLDESERTGFAFCNLVEVNAQKIKTEEDFYEACEIASFVATVQALYTDFKYLSEASRKIAERDAAIGVSITGILASEFTRDKNTLSKGAEIVKNTNDHWSRVLGINRSRTTTTVKPSGNASTILGLYYSGVHPAHDKTYIRSIQIKKNSPEYEALKDTPLIQPMRGEGFDDDALICFPIEVEGEEVFTKDSYSTVDHLKFVAMVKHAWVNKGGFPDADGNIVPNNVSVTVEVEDDAWNDVAAIIYANDHLFTGLSFLPKVGDSNYPNAPFRRVSTPERQSLYDEIKSYIENNDIDFQAILSKRGELESGSMVAQACQGGACEI